MQWERQSTAFQSGLRALRLVLASGLLAGFIAGASLALAALGDFSAMPDYLGFVGGFVAGILIGMQLPSLHHSLLALALTVPVSIAVSTLSLFYPELRVERLGTEVALELSVLEGLVRNVLLIPFLVVGLLVSKMLSRNLD